jgi:uncharacterized membrane protein
MAGTGSGPEIARRLALASLAVLALSVVAVSVAAAGLPNGAWLGLGLMLPLLLPLPGLLRRTRRTYAWATLVLAPYVIYGVTEAVANPVARTSAATVLIASLASFVALVAYLRVTRPRGAEHQSGR